MNWLNTPKALLLLAIISVSACNTKQAESTDSTAMHTINPTEETTPDEEIETPPTDSSANSNLALETPTETDPVTPEPKTPTPKTPTPKTETLKPAEKRTFTVEGKTYTMTAKQIQAKLATGDEDFTFAWTWATSENPSIASWYETQTNEAQLAYEAAKKEAEAARQNTAFLKGQ